MKDTLKLDSTSGKVSGEANLINMGPLDISISEVRIAVRAYSPYVSNPIVVGDYQLQDEPY